MQDLGTFGGFDSGAYGVSADGSVVVGMATSPGGFEHAFRWTAATGMVLLPDLGGGWSAAFSVSADGQVVVGVTTTAAMTAPFRWTAPAESDSGLSALRSALMMSLQRFQSSRDSQIALDPKRLK